MARRRRIVLAKMGLDCHDTGIVIVAHLLRDRGYEVIYLGLHNSAEQVAEAAIQESADAIGISFLSGQHMTQMRRLFEAMRAAALDVPVFCGGVIPPNDAAELKRMGAAEVLSPGTLSADLVARVENVLGGAAAQ